MNAKHAEDTLLFIPFPFHPIYPSHDHWSVGQFCTRQSSQSVSRTRSAFRWYSNCWSLNLRLIAFPICNCYFIDCGLLVKAEEWEGADSFMVWMDGKCWGWVDLDLDLDWAELSWGNIKETGWELLLTRTTNPATHFWPPNHTYLNAIS